MQKVSCIRELSSVLVSGGSTAFIRSSIKQICSICSVSAGGLQSGSEQISFFFQDVLSAYPPAPALFLKSIRLALINLAVAVGYVDAHWS